jgi:hypothetical protein
MAPLVDLVRSSYLGRVGRYPVCAALDKEELRMEWLLPICLFWILAALYLGAWPVEVVGGNGFRQVMGVVDSYILYILVWGLLRAVLGGIGGLFWDAVIPTVLASLALPLIVWAGYIVMGVRVQHGERPH